MKRNLQELSSRKFDLVVIGAGIYGVSVAWDAVSRGLKVALIDQNDFGSGTSANSLKIIHGGLRYLQSLDFVRMRHSIEERRLLLKNASHWVRPLECVMPTYGHGLKGREALALALKLNDWISSDRNDGLAIRQRLESGRMLSRQEMMDHVPGVFEKGLTGGAFWSDAMMNNAERLTLAFVRMAFQHGACVANYVKACSLVDGGIQVADGLSENKFTVHANFVVNTTGPWASAQLGGIKPKLSRAFNVVLKKQIIPRFAVGIHKPGKQVKFMVPWRGCSIVGTAHLPFNGNQDPIEITHDEVQEFLEDFNACYPGDHLTWDDVSFIYKGLLPGTPDPARPGQIKLQNQYEIIEKGNVLSVVGVKYTTARGVAEKTVDRVVKKLGETVRPCQTKRTSLDPVELDHFNDQSKLTENVVKIAIQNEMAMKLSDVIMRRLPLGTKGLLDPGVIQVCADVMAHHFKWTEEKKYQEISAVEDIFKQFSKVLA